METGESDGVKTKSYKIDTEEEVEVQANPTANSDHSVIEKIDDIEEEKDWLKDLIDYIIGLAKNLLKEENLTRMMDEAKVVNCSKVPHKKFAIRKMERIPQDYTVQWKLVREKNLRISGEDLALIFLWTTHAYHMIRVLEDESLNRKMVDAFRQCPTYIGTGHKGQRKARDNSSQRIFESYSADETIATNFDPNVKEKRFRANEAFDISQMIVTQAHEKEAIYTNPEHLIESLS